MKRFFNYIVILAIVLLSSACEFKFKPNEEGEAVPLSVQRYDRLESRYLTTGDFSALQQMNTDYPIETRTLIEKMLQLGTITDANISNRFLMFYVICVQISYCRPIASIAENANLASKALFICCFTVLPMQLPPICS